MSELKVYSDALTQDVVEADMCLGRPSWDCRGLVGKYTFDDRTTSDHSGAAWHGRLYLDEQDTGTLFTKRKGEQALRFTGQVGGVRLCAACLLFLVHSALLCARRVCTLLCDTGGFFGTAPSTRLIAPLFFPGNGH